MRIEPREKILLKGDTFTVNIVVESSEPTNVFAGEVHFDPEILYIKGIDYNTSIADLWAELPWYSNGDGTLKFAGGTTRAGGFSGSDTLITIEFETLREGDGIISIHTPRVLRHDGLGTDIELAQSRDALFTVAETMPNLITEKSEESTYRVAESAPSTDLNGDGKQSLADISIFMLHITSDDPQYDFNLDGDVTIKDLNILLDAE